VRAILKHSKINLSRLIRKQTRRRAGEILGAQLAFEVTREFVDAPRGHVTTPAPDAVVLGTHSVYLLEYSDKQNRFEFINSWGPGWGDNGKGYVPSSFIDERMTESWAVDDSPAELLQRPGIQELQWDVRDPLGDRLYGLEIYDGDANERIGWSFVVHRGDHFDIEELYVRPAYRGRRFGGRLTAMVQDLAQRHGHALRAWVPFVDCQEGNRPALARTLLKLGLNIRRSGVRWAAYLALPSKRQPVIFEDVAIPRPPAYSRSDARRADDGAPGFNGQGGQLAYDGEPSDDALSEIAESLFRLLDAEESEHADR
jgi:GNAT superfamily N-acetyltransferase